MNKPHSIRYGIIIALSVFVVDIVTKYIFYSYVFASNHHITVTSFLNLVEAWNKGISFSMFADSGTGTIIVLSLFSMIIIFSLTVWLKHETKLLSITGIGLVIGGALGNLVNRIYNGAVFDFIDFHINTLHWPAFNFADSAIVIGCFMVIINNISCRQHVKKVTK